MTRAISSALMILGAKELGWRGPECPGSTQASVPFHRRNRANWRAVPLRPAAGPEGSPSRGPVKASAASLVNTRSSAARPARNLDRHLTR